MAALTVDFRKHSEPTPADDMAVQIITDCGNFTLDLKQHGFCASPLFLQTLGPWFPNEMLNLLSSEKRTLDHWATVQFFFSFTQVRCFWRCFCFRSGLVALLLKMSERGDSWCTDSASVYSLWSSPKCLNRLCLTVFSSLRSSMLLLHIFLPNFFLPVNFAFNMLWYSTPWTATPFSNDPLWLNLCGGCQWLSSGPLPSQQCFPLLWFQRTRDLYCMDGHLLKLKCKYSNILSYWFLTFISCKL